MKEFFEDRKLTGMVNITCVFENGPTRMWTQDKAEVVATIVSIVNRYRGMGLVLSLRQLHYQMVSHNPKYVNHDKAYKKLGLILDDCRYAGIIDWDAVEDRGRVPYLPFAVDSVEEGLDVIYRQYKRNRQEGQDSIIEVWTEKDALSGIIRRPTSKYHVRLVVNKGYTSSSAIYDAYERVVEAYNDQKIFIILYVGDHDPSGLDMIRDVRDRLYFMLANGDNKIDNPEEYLQIVPIALTMAQIQQYNLPPNPTKLTDSRSDGYVAKFGTTSWELDALDPEVLIDLIEQGILVGIDIDKYEAMLETEKADKKKLKSFMGDYNPNDEEKEDDE